MDVPLDGGTGVVLGGDTVGVLVDETAVRVLVDETALLVLVEDTLVSGETVRVVTLETREKVTIPLALEDAVLEGNMELSTLMLCVGVGVGEVACTVVTMRLVLTSDTFGELLIEKREVDIT